MKNKKGFTLIELLRVIILVIVVLIAVPTITGITKVVKNNMLDKKLKIIKQAAILYGEDKKELILNSDEKYENNFSKTIIVSDLVPNYIDKDNTNNCLRNNSSGTIGCIVNPRDKNSYLDKLPIIIYYKNKRIYAIIENPIN